MAVTAAATPSGSAISWPTAARASPSFTSTVTEGPPGSGATLVEDQRTGGLDILARERERNWPDAETLCIYDPSPGKALHQVARRQEADLLVVGSCHHSAVGRVLLKDDTRAAFNGAPCALAIAPRAYSAHEGGVHLIGVGYNATPESERALIAARHLAGAGQVPGGD